MRKTLVVSGLVLGVGSVVSSNIYDRFVTAEPNEWLLLIKDGKLKESGVGISTFRGFNEIVVKFPSLLNKVSFSAQQVSKEMQGIEVNGFIVWVVKRDGECPLKAYRHIRNLSNLQPDSEVNMHIKSMAESIVRHQIANLGINDVISQRKKVRDGITAEMQEILSGWGIWLETVEITEVKILSSSLFNDLQQQFRAETRETAENIKIESNFKINNLRNERDIATRITRQKQEQELNAQREEIKRANIEMTNKTKLIQCKMDQQIEKEKIEMTSQTKLVQCKMDLQIQKENQQIRGESVEHDIKMKDMQHAFELKKVQEQYAMDAKMGDISMKKQVLQTVENVYRSMNVRDMKIVQFGANASLEHGVGKMAMAFREISNQLDEKPQ
eukprot:CAMPEP_0197055550 /NCGR_PEP_ID=MMETSP1384-20130603/67902_1 /TAXON_ID=29189 /ORGANISM="Ammonia sp." /LENGTH=384 /DNA_ID=CAMNT_0042489167 /DNA_START=15 /DNA_END=1169 /DNA_ORIENTATION=-